MSSGNQGSTGVIVVAIIGLVTALGTAVIQNWNNLFPKPTVPSSGSTISSTGGSSQPELSPGLPSEPSPESPSPELPPEPSPESLEPSEDVIKSAVITAYIHKRNGLLTGNLSELQKSYTGEALKNLEAFVTGNAASGASAILINYDYNYTKFEDYQVIDNTEKVKIRATRQVNNVTYWKDGFTCIGYQQGYDRTEDFELERTPRGWLINSIVVVEGTENVKDPPCPVDRLP